MEESKDAGGGTFYDRVYEAARPELFFKSAAWRVVTDGEPIAIRADSANNVPEPELGLLLTRGGEIAGYVVVDDVSSRSIEGENPLYLPQAKIYAGACALGPALLVPADWSQEYNIELRITDPFGTLVFEDRTSTASMRRSLSVLTEFLRRDNPVPAGSVLLTGTGIVPHDEVTLEPGMSVEIRIPEIGVLRNPVRRPEPKS
jgi:2-dehydro-3-deoxy-D-arabinonate dehydratase